MCHADKLGSGPARLLIGGLGWNGGSACDGAALVEEMADQGGLLDRLTAGCGRGRLGNLRVVAELEWRARSHGGSGGHFGSAFVPLHFLGCKVARVAELPRCR